MRTGSDHQPYWFELDLVTYREPAMKIVTYNIRFGLGLDGRIDLARIADGGSESADIIALQEVERSLAAQRHGRPACPARRSI